MFRYSNYNVQITIPMTAPNAKPNIALYPYSSGATNTARMPMKAMPRGITAMPMTSADMALKKTVKIKKRPKMT